MFEVTVNKGVLWSKYGLSPWVNKGVFVIRLKVFICGNIMTIGNVSVI